MTTVTIDTNASVKKTKAGDYFVDRTSNVLYILACLDRNEVQLFSLHSGNRYAEAVIVKSAHDVTSGELVMLMGNKPNDFKEVASVDISVNVKGK